MADEVTPDIVVPSAPLLSSTNDMPVIVETPADASPAPTEGVSSPAEAEAAPTESATGETAPEGDEAETQQVVEEPAPRREDPRTRRARELEATVADQKAQIDRLIAAIERVAAPQQQQQQQPEPPRETAPPALPQRPVRESFDTPEAYDDALIAWTAATVEARIEGRRATAEEQAAQQRASDAAQQQMNERAQAWQDRRAAFMATHEDYSAVAESSDLQITHPMAQIISTHEKGPAIAYYLGQHPQEAERIAKVTGFVPGDNAANFQALMRAGLEIGKLEAKLPDAAPAQREPVSRAPAPIRPIASSSASANPPDANEMSGDEYADMRLPELQAQRRSSGIGRTVN